MAPTSGRPVALTQCYLRFESSDARLGQLVEAGFPHCARVDALAKLSKPVRLPERIAVLNWLAHLQRTTAVDRKPQLARRAMNVENRPISLLPSFETNGRLPTFCGLRKEFPDWRFRSMPRDDFRSSYIDRRTDGGAACNLSPNGVTRS